MMFGSVFRIALHDLRLTLADRAAVLWMFVLPVVFASFFGLVMSGGGSAPANATATLTVADEDGGPAAALLLAELEGEGLDLRPIDPAERHSIDGKIRTLVIPAGFSAAVLAGTEVALRLEKDPDTSEEAALLAQARIVKATSRVIGRLIEAGAAAEGDQPIAPEVLQAGKARPALVRMESRFAGRSQIIPSGFSQSIPGNTVMFVMLIALTYGAASLTTERTSGILRRLATTPLSRTEIVLGKIAGRLAIAGVQVTILVLFAAVADLVFDLAIGSALELWLVLLVYTACVAPLGVLFGGWFRDPDRAANIGVITTLIMAALGGCWWPLEIVPGAMKKVALIFPTTWAMTALHGVISFGRNLIEVGPYLVVLLAFAATFTVLAIRGLRFDD